MVIYKNVKFEIRYDKGEFNNEKLCMRFVWICL